MYGCGLRNYELCNLEQKDIYFDRKTIFVKKQKGNRDRYVPLCDLLIKGLRKYFNSENPYRWVFNSQVTDAGKPLQFTQRGVQWCIGEAKSKQGIKKKVTAPVFRHPYATHLLEEGLDIVRIKELLGHVRRDYVDLLTCSQFREETKIQSFGNTLFLSDCVLNI